MERYKKSFSLKILCYILNRLFERNELSVLKYVQHKIFREIRTSYTLELKYEPFCFLRIAVPL